MRYINSNDAQTRGAAQALRDQVSGAEAAAPALFLTALDLMAQRCATPGRGAQVHGVRELVRAQAWTDAALALIGFDRARALRRLVHDDGVWHCRIGSQWPVPEWLDDGVEFSHAQLPLAILGAALEAVARGRPLAAPAAAVPASPRNRPEPFTSACCDNYA